MMAGNETQTLIEMRGIKKRFGRVAALSGVDLELYDGEILGLLGDNGSGKSTLIKTLVGVHRPDAGKIYVRGEQVEIQSPRQARQFGIETVYQDLALVNEMSVAANVFLDRYPRTKIAGVIPKIDWKSMNERAESILRDRLNLELDVEKEVEFFSGGERQAVAIARALVTDPDVVILDEPTSALSADSARRVQELIEALNEEDISILIISHNLEEIFELADRLVVLRNGERVGSVRPERATKNGIVTMMVDGRQPEQFIDPP
jgi:ABC-type sugar transport system ATPase subunit